MYKDHILLVLWVVFMYTTLLYFNIIEPITKDHQWGGLSRQVLLLHDCLNQSKLFYDSELSMYIHVSIRPISTLFCFRGIQIVVRHSNLLFLMEALSKLVKVNLAQGEIVPHESFYIPELREKVDIRSDYIHWLQQTAARSMVRSF